MNKTLEEQMKEKLMDEFCVMFERSQDSTVIERLEAFIQSYAKSQAEQARAALLQEIGSMIENLGYIQTETGVYLSHEEVLSLLSTL